MRKFAVLIVCTLAIALVAVGGAFMFWRTKPRGTIVKEKDFGLTLPGTWGRRPTADGTGLVFRNTSGAEQVTISPFSFSRPLNSENRSSVLRELLKTHRQGEKQEADTVVTLGEPVFSDGAGTAAVRYSGEETASRRRFTCLIACGGSAAVAFYYESIGLSQQEADTRARTILDSASVTK